MAIIIAQHLSPPYKMMLVNLLSRSTNPEAMEVLNGVGVPDGHVYLATPDSEISTSENQLYSGKCIIAKSPKPATAKYPAR